MRYDIIIPSWNQMNLTIACLNSIKLHSSDYRVIFVDNASDSTEFDVVYNVLSEMPHLLIQNTVNLGFVKATNQGLSMSTAPFVVLMNNDTEAAEGWLSSLEEPLGDPKIMLSGPRTTTTKSWQGKYEAFKGWKMLNNTTMIAFFCCMAKREIFDIVGLLDEDFGPGFGDDDHFCWKVHKAGYRIALVGDLVIPHHHRSTFNKIYGKEEVVFMQNAAMQLFKNKIAEEKKEEKKPAPTAKKKYPKVEKPKSIPLTKVIKLLESRPKIIRGRNLRGRTR